MTYNSVNDYTNYTFTIIKSGSTIKIKVANQYLAYNTSTNFKFQTSEYNWTITTHSNGNEYLTASTDSGRVIAGNYGSNFVGPYMPSYLTRSDYGFVEFAVIKK